MNRIINITAQPETLENITIPSDRISKIIAALVTLTAFL